MTQDSSGSTLSGLARSLRRLTAIRVLVVVSMALPYALVYPAFWSEVPETEQTEPVQPDAAPRVEVPLEEGDPQENLPVFRHLVAAVSIQTLLYIALMRALPGHQIFQAYIQFFGDLFLISGVIYQLGEVGSFSILYFVVISVASVMIRRSAGVVVATAAAALYALVTLGLAQSWFPQTDHRLFAPAPVRTRSTGVPLTYDLAVHVLGFYAVAIFTSYLARDVTRAEEELQEKRIDLAQLQVLHRDVIQSITSGLVTTDLAGRVTSLNRAAETILEREESTLIGSPVSSVGLVENETWEKRSTELRRGAGRFRNEVVLVNESGVQAVLGYTMSLLRDDAGEPQGYILIFQDLTDWRALQERLRIQDRMAAIGEMSASLAHEVGNPLAAISGSVQMLASSLGEDPAHRKLLEITLRESHRLDRTVKGFLQFARPRNRQVVEFDIAELLAEDTELLCNEEDVRSSGVTISLALEPRAQTIKADPDQISQVFWNLVRNSLKAMPDHGGRLDITGRLEPDDQYRLIFADNGKGMTEEERSRLFHPFRSFFDGGTGIGMAIVYRIVQEHHGEIDVQSEPDTGTSISIRIPLHPTEGPEDPEDGKLPLP